MVFQKLATLDQLWDGEKLGTSAAGTAILLVNLGGKIYAYEDRCKHLGSPLSPGKMDGKMVTCNSHHWQYDLETGQGINPANVCLRSFPVKLEDNDILVDIDAPAPSK
jgi:toluene monooxygenase system ferredoxin subunit